MINPKLLDNFGYLLNPDYNELTEKDRLIRVILLAYVKHSNFICGGNIGWDELHDQFHIELTNAIGDDKFCKWSENLSEL